MARAVIGPEALARARPLLVRIAHQAQTTWCCSSKCRCAEDKLLRFGAITCTTIVCMSQQKNFAPVGTLGRETTARAFTGALYFSIYSPGLDPGVKFYVHTVLCSYTCPCQCEISFPQHNGLAIARPKINSALPAWRGVLPLKELLLIDEIGIRRLQVACSDGL